MIRLDADDVIAIILICGCLILMTLKIDHFVSGILLAIVSYYFGHKRLKGDDYLRE